MKHTLIRVALAAVLFAAQPAAHANEILNASYDISRELFEDINKSFVPYWKQKTGQDVVVKQSHAGSSR